MKFRLFSFEKLLVWQKAKEFVKVIYQSTRSFPKEEQFGLTSQLRRAAVSIASNLAEGSARQTGKDKAHFTVMAYSSLMEAINQMIIAHELEYLPKHQYKTLREQAEEISRMLNALRDAQLKSEGK